MSGRNEWAQRAIETRNRQPAREGMSMLPGTEERAMLRDAVRRLLLQEWPPERAVALAANPDEVLNAWRLLARQGLASLGGGAEGGGLRELLVAMQELGRAHCPAPLLPAWLAHRALQDQPGAKSLLAGIAGGEIVPAWSFGAWSCDPGTGALTIDGGHVDGTLDFVEDMPTATHLLLTIGTRLVIVDRASAGLTITATPGLAVPPLSRVAFCRSPAVLFDLDARSIEALTEVARLALLSRAQGAAERPFELLVDYVKVRHQFGQPIGRFQAIQHKLADNHVRLSAARLMLENAAEQFDRQAGNWRMFAHSAIAFCGPTLRRAALETQHAFGAIGYAEEHEAPRHFRRVHADTVRLGGVRQAREALAKQILERAQPLPEYDLGNAGNAFRAEVREWMQLNWVQGHKARYESQPFEQRTWDEPFSRALGEKGWLGLALPKSLGGQERTPLEQYAFGEEMERVSAPLAGAPIQLMAIAAHGTEAQKSKWIPAMLRGEVSFGLGYSEPEAGSDLASLRTRAVRDGNEWVITGQKIWTSQWMARYIWLAARTDPDAKPKHAGISMFIVPTDSPGLTVRPMKALHGKTFATVFYDGVRLPADALVGPVNGGWKVITGALATERNIMGAVVARVVSAFELLASHLRQHPDGKALQADAAVRDRVGELAADIEAARQLIVHSVALAGNDETAGGMESLVWSAMSKVFSGELMERFGETALDILGPGATLAKGIPGAVPDGSFEQFLRHSIMYVVGGGTAEIQRNVIAQRGLGLPR